MSIFRKARAKKLAEFAAKQAADASRSSTALMTEQEKMLGLLNQHKIKLKQINSIERKIELKEKILPDYMPYVDGIVAADEGGQDAVVATIMMWLIDTGDYDSALEVADYVIRYELAIPGIQFNAATLLAREMAKAYLDEQKPTEDHLLTTLTLVDDKDIVDETNAALNKAYAICIEKDNPEMALQHFDRAYKLDKKSGVKKHRDTLVKRLQGEAK